MASPFTAPPASTTVTPSSWATSSSASSLKISPARPRGDSAKNGRRQTRRLQSPSRHVFRLLFRRALHIAQHLLRHPLAPTQIPPHQPRHNPRLLLSLLLCIGGRTRRHRRQSPHASGILHVGY